MALRWRICFLRYSLVGFFILTLFSCEKKSNHELQSKEVKFALGVGTSGFRDEVEKTFIPSIQTDSNSSIKFLLEPSKSSIFADLNTGHLDIALVSTEELAAVYPVFKILLFPHNLTDDAAIDKMMQGKTGTILMEKLSAQGFLGLGYLKGAWKNLLTRKSIQKIEDLRGLSVSALFPGSSSFWFSSVGLKFTLQPEGAPYQDFREKRADGVEHITSSIMEQDFSEIGPHLFISKHQRQGWHLIASAKLRERLQPEQWSVIQKNASTLTQSLSQKVQERNSNADQLLMKSKLFVDQPNAAFISQLNALTTSMISQYQEEVDRDLLKVGFEDAGLSIPKDRSVAIALNLNLSGTNAIAARAALRGATLATQEMNRSSFATGVSFRLVTLDHGGDLDRARQNIVDILSRENVMAVMDGPDESLISKSLEEIKGRSLENLVYLLPWSFSERIIKNKLKPNPVFRLNGAEKSVAVFMAREASKAGKKIAVLLGGKDSQSIYTSAFKGLGLKPKLTVTLDAESLQPSAILQKIVESASDVVLLDADYERSTKILEELVKQNLKIPVVTTWSLLEGNSVDLKSKNFDLRILQTLSFEGNRKPLAKKVANEYFALYGGSTLTDIEGAQWLARSYDLVRLFGLAYGAMQKNQKLTLVKSMESIINFDGVVSSYKYPFKGQRDAIDVTAFRIDKK